MECKKCELKINPNNDIWDDVWNGQYTTRIDIDGKEVKEKIFDKIILI